MTLKSLLEQYYSLVLQLSCEKNTEFGLGIPGLILCSTKGFPYDLGVRRDSSEVVHS